MCGIIGIVGSENASGQVLEGLKRLEYRGYDSAGIASIQNDNGISVRRAPGKIVELETKMTSTPMGENTIAIGHTRWATHGAPTEQNAHPHISGNCAVVHNGIIENYLNIREELSKEGVTFSSETDSETLPASINQAVSKGKSDLDAVLETVRKAEGAFAFGVVFGGNKEKIIASRRGAPLVVGLGQNANYIGSDATALAPYTNKFIFLENDDTAVVTPEKITIYDINGTEVQREARIVDISSIMAGKGGYRHFMLKEIHEQPEAVSHTLTSYMDDARKNIVFPDMPFDWNTVPQVTIVACGTSYYSAMTAKYWIEEMCGIPVNVDFASEFRYRNPPTVKGGAAIFISQSGETADTLAALELCKEKDQHIISLVNVPESTIARESDVTLTTKAGTEVAVASTKAFTAQLTVFMMLAVHVAKTVGKMDENTYAEHVQQIISAPTKITQALEIEDSIKGIAYDMVNAKGALFLGRGALFPVALEGALKLKELSYIHAEGYASGEMKHGPIALIDETLPVITLAPMNDLFEKCVSNMKESEARHGKIILVTDKTGAKSAGSNSDRTLIVMPDTAKFLQPLLMTIPMQLLSYYVAVEKGTDVDQPRNLAKSVTVE